MNILQTIRDTLRCHRRSKVWGDRCQCGATFPAATGHEPHLAAMLLAAIATAEPEQ